MKHPAASKIFGCAILAVLTASGCGSSTNLPSSFPDCGISTCGGPLDGPFAVERDAAAPDASPDSAPDLAPDVAPDVAPDLAPDLATDLAAPDADAAVRLDTIPAFLDITPAVHEYPPTPVGETSDGITFTVINRGGSPLALIDVAVNGADFVLAPANNHCAGVTALAPDATCTVAVTFQPSSRGIKSGAVIVRTPGQTATASLSGLGQSPAALAVAPTTAIFAGTVGKTSAATSILVANVGDLPTAAVTVALAGTDASSFKLISNGCLAPLSMGASCTVQVAFNPTSAGMKVATVVASSSVGGMASVMLGGRVLVAGSPTIAPAMADFGSVAVGFTSQAMAFEVKHNGGSATAALMVYVSTTEFVITANTCSGVALAPSATCSVAMAFRPSSSGTKTALLTITDGATLTLSAQLSGTAP